MKRIYAMLGIGLLVVFLTIIFFVTPQAQAAVDIGTTSVVKLTYSRVILGSYSLTIRVAPQTGQNVAGLQMTLDYPVNVLVKSITQGDLLSRSGMPVMFAPGQVIPGRINNIVAVIVGKATIYSEGIFVVIKAKKVKAGEILFTIRDLVLGNDQGSQIQWAAS